MHGTLVRVGIPFEPLGRDTICENLPEKTQHHESNAPPLATLPSVSPRPHSRPAVMLIANVNAAAISVAGDSATAD